MESHFHERQGEMIRDIETRLTRIETLLDERNKKSDMMLQLISEINVKLEGLPEKYISKSEFVSFKEGLSSRLTERTEGMKQSHAVIISIITVLLSSILPLVSLIKH